MFGERMKRVVIIDDSDINLTLLSTLVQKLGDCEPILFQNPAEALEWCFGNEPELILVDYMMPGIDGLEFVSRYCQVRGRHTVPILMITANDDKSIRYEALQRGAIDFLTKPIDRIEFSARVQNMLALRSSQKKLADLAGWLAEEVRSATAAVYTREQELVLRMSRAAEFRDPETGAHVQRVGHYCRVIATRIGLPSEERDLVLQAAPMHDIGKIGIPDRILLKPDKLTEEEFSRMKQHTIIGRDLLNGSESRILQAAAIIAVAHHEKFDGSGYPYGYSGAEIPLLGRIAAVADVFDALTSERPYKKAWSLTQAREYVREHRKTHFDPNCVDAFLGSNDEIMSIHSRYRDAAE
jgi:putative two-component system response regulator